MAYKLQGKECFFDDFLLNTALTTAQHRIHHPEKKECVLVLDEPWEGDACSYFQFFRDGDIYRMYYTACKFDSTNIAPVICYAESTDGIHWVKPKLGIHEFNGSRDNNIVMKTMNVMVGCDNFMVFRDDNPACPPEEKYKAVGVDYTEVNGETTECLNLFYSADAIHFTFDRILTTDGAFDSLNVCFWDPLVEKYRLYFRNFHSYARSSGNENMSRQDLRDVRYMESKDFEHWSEPQLLDFGDAPDIPLYTNVIQPYLYAPHIYIGFPSRYIERLYWNENFDELCGRDARYLRYKEWPRYALAVTDCVFITSRDGVHFKKYDEAFLRPGPENGRNWIYGGCFPARGMIETPSQQRGADPELSMYVKENTWMGSPSELHRFTLRKDGFVSLHAGAREAMVVTKPFLYNGSKLYANIESSAWGYLYFTLILPDGSRIESTEVFGDSVDRQIHFPDHDLSAWSGQEVTLEVRMRDADLYAIRFE